LIELTRHDVAMYSANATSNKHFDTGLVSRQHCSWHRRAATQTLPTNTLTYLYLQHSVTHN